MTREQRTSEREYVLVTEYFHPDTASTGQLLTDLAVGLQERGLDVTVYTGQPNYHSGDNERQPRQSTYEGVSVRRLPVPQLRQSSTLRRGFNWVVFTLWLVGLLLGSRPDGDRELIVVSNPPFLPIAMWLVCRLRGWEYTYIVNDVYPDAAVEAGYLSADGLVARFWTALHRRVFVDAANVVALGPAMRERILEFGGDELEPDVVEIIHYWEDETFIQPMEKADNPFAREHDLVEPFTVLYSGNIGINHDLETVVRAASRLEDEPVRVLVIGEGDRKEAVTQLAEELGVAGGTLQFLPYQHLDDLPYTLTAGDVSLVTVSEGMKGVCVSCKIYTSMAAGMPILVISESGDDEKIILTRHDAGIHATQGDVEGVVDAIRTWMENPDLVERQGTNAREALETRYTKDESLDQYYELLTGETPPERKRSR